MAWSLLLNSMPDLSSSHPDVRCCFLDWSAALDPDGIAPLTSLLNDEIDADLILGADIVSMGSTSLYALTSSVPQVFDPDLISALVAVLRLALQPNSRPRYALIALTVRNPTTMQKFEDAVQSAEVVLFLAPT